MQADRFTLKTQEALQSALNLAPEQRHKLREDALELRRSLHF